MADHYNPRNVWSPKGRGFNMGVAQAEGVTIHMTGQVAWDANENIIGKNDITAQTSQCFENIQNMLKAVGGCMDDLVSITTYYTDQSQLSHIQKVRKQYLQQDKAPASTSVMVAGLGHPDFLVELTPIAVIPRDRYKAPD